jgi:hypothetical protein
MKNVKKPVMLTVNGEAELVVQTPRGTRNWKQKTEWKRSTGVKRGLESMKRGGGKPAEKFFQELFAAEGISEHE